MIRPDPVSVEVAASKWASDGAGGPAVAFYAAVKISWSGRTMYYTAEFLVSQGGRAVEIVPIACAGMENALIWARGFFDEVLSEREPDATGFRLLDPAEAEVWPFEAMRQPTAVAAGGAQPG